jgi:A/G-specific adenine glycosylase
MLQQTQVDRVMPKFEAFVARFPDERQLATASLADVLQLWSGLGYNRRAKHLHDAAKKIQSDYRGSFPATKDALLRLPGIGPGTAGAILAYAYNQPVVFVETNIRTVYFHHFFAPNEAVSDSQLVPFIEQTLDHIHPREFYWALMDYGSWLKKQGHGSTTRSRHYKKQPALAGSVREVRGRIVRLLVGGDMTMVELQRAVVADDRFEPALSGLVRDGLVAKRNTTLHLTK